MNINPGEFNKKIDIVKYEAGGIDDDGFPVTSKRTVVRSCKAKVTNTSGKEVFKANTEMIEVNKRFLVRYTATAIDTNMIVEYRGVEYEIKYISDFEDKHEYLEIWVKRRVQDGVI